MQKSVIVFLMSEQECHETSLRDLSQTRSKGQLFTDCFLKHLRPAEQMSHTSSVVNCNKISEHNASSFVDLSQLFPSFLKRFLLTHLSQEEPVCIAVNHNTHTHSERQSFVPINFKPLKFINFVPDFWAGQSAERTAGSLSLCEA